MRGFDRLLYLAFLVGMFVVLRAIFQVEPPGPGEDRRVFIPNAGDPLSPSAPSDPSILVDAPQQSGPGSGTAFSLGDGAWLTARHVVDGCAQVGVLTSRRAGVVADGVSLEPQADVAVLRTQLNRAALPLALNPAALVLGERGYHLGFPQGAPGDVSSRLLGREVLITRGRWRRAEPVLGWAETGRTRGLSGSLGGLSGGPAFIGDGKVVGVTIAENPRRGRIYTAAPRSVKSAVRMAGVRLQEDAEVVRGLDQETYTIVGAQLRESVQVAKVLCSGPA